MAKPVQTPIRVGLITQEPSVGSALKDYFTQLGINVSILAEPADLTQKKYEGCVVDLRRDDAGTFLETARSSARNRGMVLFGLYSDQAQLKRFSRHGINALFALPLRRPDVLKVLRSTQTLLLHELRRYARVPLATAVELSSNGHRWSGISRELSTGGMSIKFERLPSIVVGEPVTASLLIPPGVEASLSGTLCWRYEPDSLVGVKFLPDQNALNDFQAWVSGYLGIE